MKQAVTVAPKTMEMQETPIPEAGPGEALIRVEAVGLCGSDLHLYSGDDPYSRFPLRQGHEYAGTVVAFGDGDEASVEIGELVAVEPLIPDGTCIACRRGRPNCCVNLKVQGAHVPGALCEYITARVERLYPVGGLDPMLAAFVEPVSIGVHMVARSGLGEGEQAVVFGAGPIGQAVLLAGRARNTRWLVVDRVPERLELAKQLGAEVMVDARTDPVEEAIEGWTAGDGPTTVFEATGVATVVRQAVEVVAHSGTVVVAGTPNEEVCIPAMTLVRKEVSLLASRNNAGVFGRAVQVVTDHQQLVRRLITHEFPLEEVGQAIEFARANPGEAEKVMILPTGDA